MKVLLLAVLCLLFNLNVSAITYYVASDGNDNNTGQSVALPWKTISKINSKMSSFRAGDVILFRRGDTFAGTLQINVSGTSSSYITFGAYGTGNLPIFAGHKALTNWTPLVGYPNVWESTYTWSQSKIASLFVNNQLYAMGRFPNLDQEQGGYLIYDSYVGKTQIKDNELSTSIDWTGAEAVVRGRRWVLDRPKILFHDVPNRTLNIDPNEISVNIGNKYGYFIQNHLKTLDKNFEWAYNATTKKVYIYANTDPNQLDVKISNVNNLIVLNSAKYILIENLDLEMSNEDALLITDGSYIKVNNCVIDFAGKDAIELSGNAKYCTFESNQIRNANSMGIFVSYVAENNLISKNVLRSIGAKAGLGASGGESYTGIYLGGPSNTVQFNDIDSVGYNGIGFFAKNSIIQNNLVKNTCFVKNDGGGIYTHTENYAGLIGCKILNNVILYVDGNPNGTDTPTVPLCAGIYVDGFSGGIEIKNNTVAFANYRGMYLHNSINTNVENNTFYANYVQVSYINDASADGRPMVNNLVKNNIFASVNKEQFFSLYNLINDNIDDVVNIDDNYYLNPFAAYQNFSYTYDKSFPNLSTRITEQLVLNQKQVRYNIDKNSHDQPIKYPTYFVNGIQSSNYVKNPNFNTNSNFWAPFGSNINGAGMSNVAKVQRVTNSPLGNALLISFNNYSGQNNKSTAYFRTETSVAQNAKYLLKFDVVSTGNKQTMEVVFRKHGTSYDNLAKVVFVPLTTAIKKHEILFDCNSSSSDARVDFIIEEQDSLAWIDNVEFYKVDASYTNDSQELMKLLYNPSSTTLTQALDDIYMDKDGFLLGNSISIPPYGSQIIFKVLTKPEFWVETECATEIGTNWEKTIDANASNGNAVKVKNGLSSLNNAPVNSSDWLRFDFEINQTGNYKVQARIKTPSGSSDSFWVKMDNGIWFRWWENILFPNFNWATIPNTYTLNKGNHSLYFGLREAGATIDKIYITYKDTTFQGLGELDYDCCPIAGTPCNDNNPFTLNDVEDGNCNCAGLAIGDTWLEAECPVILGSAWESKSDNNASNTTYITPKIGFNSTNAAPSNAGSSITYNFTVAENKNYDIWARIHAPNSADDSFWIKVDNQNWLPWYTAINSTYTWQKLPLGTLNLLAGYHTVSFAYREDGVRLDKILIASSPSSSPTALGNAANNCATNATQQQSAARTIKVEEETAEITTSKLGIKVSPNPIQDFVIIDFETKNTDETSKNELQLFDIKGVLIAKWSNLGRKGTIETNLGHLSKGIYILKMQANGEVYQTKISKL